MQEASKRRRDCFPKSVINDLKMLPRLKEKMQREDEEREIKKERENNLCINLLWLLYLWFLYYCKEVLCVEEQARCLSLVVQFHQHILHLRTGYM